MSDRIFVSIACYRDAQIVPTVQQLFERAAQPSKLHVGICWQIDTANDSEEMQWVKKVESVREGHIDSIIMHFSKAEGPCLARHKAQQLISEEDEFMLQIDSHMRFIDDFDDELRTQWRQCRQVSERPILTTYPLEYVIDPEEKISEETKPTITVADRFDTQSDGMIRLNGKLLNQYPAKPVPSLFWVAGFAFSSSSVVKDVPYSPNLPQLFFGEELSMGARLYTHGYDCFAPTRAIVYHLWTRSHRPLFNARSEIVSARRTMNNTSADNGDNVQQGGTAPRLSENELLNRDERRLRRLKARSLRSVCEQLKMPLIGIALELSNEHSDDNNNNNNNNNNNSSTNSSYSNNNNNDDDDGEEDIGGVHSQAPNRVAAANDDAAGGKYGLGSTRTLQEYAAHVDIDFKRRKIGERARLGGVDERMHFDYIFKLIQAQASNAR